MGKKKWGRHHHHHRHHGHHHHHGGGGLLGAVIGAAIEASIPRPTATVVVGAPPVAVQTRTTAYSAYGAGPYAPPVVPPTPMYGAPGMVPPGQYGPSVTQTTTTAYGAPGMPGPMPGQMPGPYATPGAPYGGAPYGGAPYGGVTQTTSFGSGYGAPGYPTPAYGTGYGMPGPMPGQMTGAMPGQMPGQMPGAVRQTTTTYAPVVTSCFGRPVQLFNHHGKFLTGGHHRPHGHRNPHHEFSQSSYWFIEPHDGFSDKVRLRNTNGKYLCHDGFSNHCSLHHVASSFDVAWHMEMFPGWSGQNVLFRSHGGKFLSLDVHDDHVHCRSHWGGPHESQRFEIRYC